ncbi:MAG TPA: hypothetical protein PLP29_17375 [Candidatus Ozemobacteraceae bacterium]|nr:hypothetical protein [Candidatus Ozemobacteraceae bacterium]
MKRLMHLVLAVVLVCGVYGHCAAGYAQEETSGEEQTQQENTGEGTVPENPPEEAANNNEAPPSEEQPPAEDKVYSCSKCGYTSDGPGDCPACNISLTEGAPPSDDTSSTGGDSSEPTGDESSSDSGSSDNPPPDSGSSDSGSSESSGE